MVAQTQYIVTLHVRCLFCSFYPRSDMTEVFLNLTEGFLTLTEVFPCFFLSCKANASVKLAKTGHRPHSTTLVCICVIRMLLFVLFYVVFVCKCVLPPGDNRIAVNKYIISYRRSVHKTFLSKYFVESCVN
jgi:hypothetical protein